MATKGTLKTGWVQEREIEKHCVPEPERNRMVSPASLFWFVDTDHNIHDIPTYLFSQQLGADPIQECVHYSRTARRRQ